MGYEALFGVSVAVRVSPLNTEVRRMTVAACSVQSLCLDEVCGASNTVLCTLEPRNRMGGLRHVATVTPFPDMSAHECEPSPNKGPVHRGFLIGLLDKHMKPFRVPFAAQEPESLPLVIVDVETRLMSAVAQPQSRNKSCCSKLS